MLRDNAIQLDDTLYVVDDEVEPEQSSASRVWRILVVDDDEDVHDTTRFALKNAEILGRPVALLHARSVDEAWKRLSEYDDIAVALVDVVMETSDAGLTFVRALREAGYHNIRIVLRTGQPAYAPELSVVSTYEIDDYRTKSELTQTRLLTVLTTAIRGYNQIDAISRSRSGLEMIVESAAELFRRTNLELFARGVLTQIAALLRVEPNGIVCSSKNDRESPAEHSIICAAGGFADCTGKSLSCISDPIIFELLARLGGNADPAFENGYMALQFRSDTGRVLSVIIEADCELSGPDLALLKLFSTNISIGVENLALLERLDTLAYVDPVLQVPNLNAFELALRNRLERDSSDGRMALMNLDAFPTIIASYGPRITNRFLQSVYHALADGRDDVLTVARAGDGTFALLGDASVLDDVLVSNAMAEPYVVNGIKIATTASTAVIDLADVAPDPGEIMRTANSTLLQVTQTRRGECVTYDTGMRSAVERRVALQFGLKQTVEGGDGFSVFLQPKVNLVSGEVLGSEALLRWNYEGENVGPAEFVPIAESAGLTHGLTDFVVDSVGRWVIACDRSKTLPVAVNLSMTDLNSPGFAKRLLNRVAAAGLSPETIEFEVTEGIAMQQNPWAIEQVQALKDAGFRIALDDFGTGYSSLGHFDKLPIDTLKIDRSFVTPLAVGTARNSLASIMIGMGQALNVKCVAEGIETLEQQQALAFLGCDIGQGYYFGRPVHIDEFADTFLS